MANAGYAETSKTKDAIAWTILYGGTAAAQFALTTLAVSAGLLDKNVAKAMKRTLSKAGPQFKRMAWEKYQKTGSIIKMFESD